MDKNIDVLSNIYFVLGLHSCIIYAKTELCGYYLNIHLVTWCNLHKCKLEKTESAS